MPMLLYGARQTGKTYVMQELGTGYFKNQVYINFEADQRAASLFQSDITPEYLWAKGKDRLAEYDNAAFCIWHFDT